MSNYTKITDFAAKDALASGNPAKIISGTGIDNEFNAIATAVNSKANAASPTFTGTITTALTASRALVTGASNELAASAVTATELGYVSGVTSAIQTQLNLLAPKANPTFTGTLTAAAIAGTTGTFSGAVSCTALTATAASSISGGLALPGTGQLLTIGDDAAFYDINVGNTMGLYGQTNSAVGALKLGSGGPTLSGASGALTVNGNITASDFIISSDARLKENIHVLGDSAAIVEALRGYRFNYKESGKPSVGFIAQEVRQVLPELVHEDAEGFLAVSYSQVVAVLVEEVKSLRKRLDALEAR